MDGMKATACQPLAMLDLAHERERLSMSRHKELQSKLVTGQVGAQAQSGQDEHQPPEGLVCWARMVVYLKSKTRRPGR